MHQNFVVKSIYYSLVPVISQAIMIGFDPVRKNYGGSTSIGFPQ